MGFCGEGSPIEPIVFPSLLHSLLWKYIAKGLNPTLIQRERSQPYRQLRATVYRKVGPSLMQRERSLMYTEGNDGGCIQEELNPSLIQERDPTCIQKEPSWALNEVTID